MKQSNDSGGKKKGGYESLPWNTYKRLMKEYGKYEKNKKNAGKKNPYYGIRNNSYPKLEKWSKERNSLKKNVRVTEQWDREKGRDRTAAQLKKIREASRRRLAKNKK